jgi:hypothetical protein
MLSGSPGKDRSARHREHAHHERASNLEGSLGNSLI